MEPDSAEFAGRCELQKAKEEIHHLRVPSPIWLTEFASVLCGLGRRSEQGQQGFPGVALGLRRSFVLHQDILGSYSDFALLGIWAKMAFRKQEEG